MLERIEDAILSWLQRRCHHDGMFVAADVLEGAYGDDVQVKWCRRCGAIETEWNPGNPGARARDRSLAALEHTMRRPDPNMWRG